MAPAITMSMLPRLLVAAATEDMPDDVEGEALDWQAVAWMGAYFTPGFLVGLVVGRFVNPVNAVLGWIFRGFNRGFDHLTTAYGWIVSNS